ncbi:hypothetical protein [Flexivirga caeni]|uniref:Uncharacterized protein n=1 Tax=Flexivirga caeni TaxID=2294115 RepID=A0A3M9MIG2_9MICO|nr:hypothetical protein [Flexivirga caeni]RNI25321.1 hypothetical protein EFY87_01430 [Flexivirga caeni]
MGLTLAEVLDAARALSRSERATVAQELIATLATTDDVDEARHTQLKDAVDFGLDQIERGEGIRVPAGELRDYLHGLGREATERVTRRPA